VYRQKKASRCAEKGGGRSTTTTPFSYEEREPKEHAARAARGGDKPEMFEKVCACKREKDNVVPLIRRGGKENPEGRIPPERGKGKGFLSRGEGGEPRRASKDVGKERKKKPPKLTKGVDKIIHRMGEGGRRKKGPVDRGREGRAEARRGRGPGRQLSHPEGGSSKT